MYYFPYIYRLIIYHTFNTLYLSMDIMNSLHDGCHKINVGEIEFSTFNGLNTFIQTYKSQLQIHCYFIFKGQA